MSEYENSSDFKTVDTKDLQKKTKKRSKKLTLFSSNIVGQKIRNALSGTESEYRVGSVHEKLFWKVVTKDNERWGTDLNTGEPKLVSSGYDMATYFYDSPEQYERLYNIELDENMKNDWYSKNGKIKLANNEED